MHWGLWVDFILFSLALGSLWALIALLAPLKGFEQIGSFWNAAPRRSGFCFWALHPYYENERWQKILWSPMHTMRSRIQHPFSWINSKINLAWIQLHYNVRPREMMCPPSFTNVLCQKARKRSENDVTCQKAPGSAGRGCHWTNRRQSEHLTINEQ